MANRENLINQALVRDLLTYDPACGEFRWNRAMRRASAGDLAGAVRGRGYLAISLLGLQFYAHRIAFLWMTGSWPEGVVDHIDGVKKNNRWLNLRDVSTSLNGQNQRAPMSTNSFGLLGAHRCRDKFRSTIVAEGRSIHLGVFTSPLLAHEAYLNAKRELHEGCTL